MRIAFYTWGMIGGGHLARAWAIKRGLERAGLDADFRVFYGQLGVKAPKGLPVVFLSTPRADLADPEKAKDSETARALLEFAPDLLLVDLAWAELQHILPLPGCEAWLLLRWCAPLMIENLRGPYFNPQQYQRVIATEPIAPEHLSDRIDPIVGCNIDECLPESALRELFGVDQGKSISLVVQAGRPGECEELVRQETERNNGFHVIAASLHTDIMIFPIAPYFRGADRIVGGAGYNLYWETRWLGLRDRTELRSFVRYWDDQTPRIQAPEYEMKENGADTLVRQIAGRSPDSWGIPVVSERTTAPLPASTTAPVGEIDRRHASSYNRTRRPVYPEQSEHTVRRVRAECSQLFMIYQGRRGRLMIPALEFLRITKLHDRNMVLFRDQKRADYQQGLSPEIPSMAAFLEWQKAQCVSFPHARTTYCLGTSVGAYAAIASGYFLKVPIVWAFAPLTLMEEFVGPDDDISVQCRDLRTLLSTGNGVTEYRVFYNENHQDDRVAAERIAECPGVKLFPQPGDTHQVVVTMAGLGRLENLIIPFEPV